MKAGSRKIVGTLIAVLIFSSLIGTVAANLTAAALNVTGVAVTIVGTLVTLIIALGFMNLIAKEYDLM